MLNDLIESIDDLKSSVQPILNDRSCFGPHYYEDIYSTCKYEVHYPLKYLGAGGKRVAFSYLDRYCIKFAVQVYEDRSQMKEEIQLLKRNFSCFPQLYAYDDKSYDWEIVELCKKPTSVDILNATAHHYEWFEDLYPIFDLIMYYNFDVNKAIQFAKNDKQKAFLEFLLMHGQQQKAYLDPIQCWKENHMQPRDVFNSWNIGIATRDSEDVLIIIDAGK